MTTAPPTDPNWRWTAGGWQYWGRDGWWYQREPDPKGAWWRQAVDGTWQFLAVDGQWHLPPSPAALGAAAWAPPSTAPAAPPSTGSAGVPPSTGSAGVPPSTGSAGVPPPGAPSIVGPFPGSVPPPVVDTRTGAAPVNTYSRLAIIFGSMALVLLPPILGIAGIVLASIAISRREPLGRVGLIISVIGLVGGMVIAVVAYHALHSS